MGTVVGGLLLAGGLVLGWLAFATPVVQGLDSDRHPTNNRTDPPRRPSSGACRSSGRRASRSSAPSAWGSSPRTCCTGPRSGRSAERSPCSATSTSSRHRSTLPDGRAIRNVVDRTVRGRGDRRAPRAEQHAPPGHRLGSPANRRPLGGPSSIPSSAPRRDAERIRHWIAAEDRDFLVKVYAAVRDPRRRRSPGRRSCAAITARPDPRAGWRHCRRNAL